MRLIDGDALIDNICRYASPEMAWDRIDIVHKINEMPTIEEHNTGKWIPYEFGDDTWHKCTACGIADHYISIVQRPNGTTGRLKSVRNFCPNCGAKMEGEENG